MLLTVPVAGWTRHTWTPRCASVEVTEVGMFTMLGLLTLAKIHHILVPELNVQAITFKDAYHLCI